MSKGPRDTDPAAYRLITIRTDGARLWMMPSKNIAKIIGGVLARYQEILKIQIFAYCFLTNHYHLLIRAPLGNTDEFEENVNREIARRINWFHHRKGSFWGCRYDDRRLVDIKALSVEDDDLLRTFLYVTTNAVRHGLVRHPSEWTGLHCYDQLISGNAKTFSFYHHSAEEGQARVTRHSLVITPLEKFGNLTKDERTNSIVRLVQDRCDDIIKFRAEAGKGFLGIKRAREAVPGSQPETISGSPRRYCFTSNLEMLREFRIAERTRRQRYKNASLRYRMGELDVCFPSNTFKPPLNRFPRSRAFTAMSAEHFKTAA